MSMATRPKTAFSQRHKNIPWPDNAVDGGYRCCSTGQGRNCLDAADNIRFSDSGRVTCRQDFWGQGPSDRGG